jgi:hypothetical protein
VFLNNDKLNILRGAIAIIVLASGCIFSIVLYKQAMPLQIERDTINITRQEYEQALALWEAQGAEQYELSWGTDDDHIVVRVTVGEDFPVVVRQVRHGKEIDLAKEGMPELSPEYQQLTVERLFSLVAQSLSHVEHGDLPRTDNTGSSVYYDFEVTLDPVLGYPKHFAAYQRLTKAAKEITWRQRTRQPIDLRGVTVLR